MSKPIVLINRSDSIRELLNSVGTKVDFGNIKYYFLPIWFKEIEGDTKWELFNLSDSLPRELIKYMSNRRGEEIYWYKDKPYRIKSRAKYKLNGEWIPCIIYETLYEHPEGEIWVRSEFEFFELFNKKK